MITTTVAAATDAVQAFRNLLAVKMPAKTAFQLARIARAVGAEVDTYEEQRVALVKRLGAADEAGNYTVNKDNLAQFQAELQPLLESTIDFAFEPVKISDLGDAKVLPSDLWALESFIVADGE